MAVYLRWLMKVHLIKWQSVEAFMKDNAGSRSSLSLWLAVLKRSEWNDPADILKSFGSADLIGNGTDRVVFNISGNKYRIICKYQFGTMNAHLFVKWIGTHAEYTRLCKNNQQYTVSIY
jgi:mRNA interferase HigB